MHGRNLSFKENKIIVDLTVSFWTEYSMMSSPYWTGLLNQLSNASGKHQLIKQLLSGRTPDWILTTSFHYQWEIHSVSFNNNGHWALRKSKDGKELPHLNLVKDRDWKCVLFCFCFKLILLYMFHMASIMKNKGKIRLVCASSSKYEKKKKKIKCYFT